MNALDHQQVIRTNFAELAKGNAEPLVTSLAEDVA